MQENKFKRKPQHKLRKFKILRNRAYFMKRRKRDLPEETKGHYQVNWALILPPSSGEKNNILLYSRIIPLVLVEDDEEQDDDPEKRQNEES